MVYNHKSGPLSPTISTTLMRSITACVKNSVVTKLLPISPSISAFFFLPDLVKENLCHSVVDMVCTDFSGKESSSQLTPESLSGVMVSTLSQNGSGVGSTPVLGTVFPIFITPTIIMLRAQFCDIEL